MKKYFLFIFGICIGNLVFSQEKQVPKSVKGFVNQTEMGVILGRSTPLLFNTTGQSKLNFTLQSFNGYRFGKRFSAGATVGLDWYTTYQVLPVEAGFRLDFPSKSRVSPYFGLDAGYGFMWLQNPPSGYKFSGGFTYNPSFGLKIDLGKESALTFSIGYKYQKVAARFVGDFDYILDTSNEYNRFSLRTGICF